MAHKVGYNNYAAYKADFKKDTGLDYNTNVKEYILYYNARSNDLTNQINAATVNEIGQANTSLRALSGTLSQVLEQLKKKA